ncbi:hypothetical protein [Novosphingobium olei]|uniref:PD-(D/E)XK nuclease superfamily protein n=1 Tax=Novosphingobium olei TaxID=2728851 RepID=A0A7Y0BT73_9SPHN|nr:hypothetical protein [Novosphingobium olei]NML96124.1 hypothetical protein [Novosphingobium olei]
MPDQTDDPKAALEIFAEAVVELLQDAELIYANPGERAIVARLVQLLPSRFPGWSVGSEWNRREDVAKRLRHGVTEDDLVREGLIVPDIIVHRVGKRENLLIIEVKKANNKHYDGDIWKLEGMTDQRGDYGYAAGLHIALDLPAGQVRLCDVYVNGEQDPDLGDWMRTLLPYAAAGV